MLILAFETSAKAGSVALLEGNKLLGESYQNTGLTHSQTLMVMAEELLKQCEKTPQDVEAVAVAAGPGSFTGVRIGVAAAKGFASRMRNSAAKRAVGGSLSLRNKGARSKKLSIAQARITEGLPPVKRA